MIWLSLAWAGVHGEQSCSLALKKDPESTAAWVSGWITAKEGKVRGRSSELIPALRDRCERAPSTSVVDLAAAQHLGDVEPGSARHAEHFLRQFLDPSNDRRALTQAMIPTEKDVRAVYDEPLASKLVSAYARMFGDVREALGPQPGQTELLVVHTTTHALKLGAPVLHEFPGGYEQVREHIRTDVPIVRFKFVKPGERIGMAYDGLVYVHGRWTILPKPWRALREATR